MKNNPDLLQEAEVENADADITSDAGKINEYDNNMNISMEKDQDIVKYQKLLKWMSKISPKKWYGDQYMKLFVLHSLRKQIFF